MDNKSWKSRLEEGAAALGLPLQAGVAEGLGSFVEGLLRWNEKINLTAITEPLEVLEKHLLDSLAAGVALGAARTVLDLGAGAGLPGIPLALNHPALAVTLVDSVAKKIGFIKSAIATLGLAPRTRAVHVNLRGSPDREGIVPADLVVSRAFMDLGKFVSFAAPYATERGVLVGMASRAQAESPVLPPGWKLEQRWDFELPFSHAPRVVLRFSRG